MSPSPDRGAVGPPRAGFLTVIPLNLLTAHQTSLVQCGLYSISLDSLPLDVRTADLNVINGHQPTARPLCIQMLNSRLEA